MNLILIMTECREPFMPDFETGKNDYLVVEGFINIGSKAVTTITLSRVAPLMWTNKVFEDDAVLFIESIDGAQYPLYGKGNGSFKSDSLNLDPTGEYRLVITAGENQYTSSFLKPKITPAIDSVHWRSEENGIQIYVSAHDPEKSTRYYKWYFEESWEIHSAYQSEFAYNSQTRDFEERTGTEVFAMFYCWQHAFPEDLNFTSTNHLEVDEIHYPLTLFAHSSSRTSVMYSILVEQRALTKEEFDYLELVQKNSTITGSLFDPMPSEINGNIQSVSSDDDKVIGYIGAYTTDITRVFISSEEFGIRQPPRCEQIEVAEEEFDSSFGTGIYIPVDSISYRAPGPKLFTGAPAYCMDCTLRGGSSTRPDFWIF